MGVIDTVLVLPRLAFITAWQIADGGDLHPAFGTGRDYWMTDEAARNLRGKTLELLAEHRLARRDRVNPLWTETIRAIAHADQEFYAWSDTADHAQNAVLVASREGHAVRVQADREAVVLEPVEPKWLATHLLDALPDVPGASVRTVEMSRAEYENHDATPSNPLAEPADTRDREYLTELMHAPRDAVHQLYTATRVGDGQRVRSLPVTALDLTGRGRVLTYRTDDEMIVVQSGTPRDVIATLNNTHGGLT